MDSAVASNPIMITIASDMDKIIFDGKWSHETEWKRSSLDTLSYDDGAVIQLRTAHQDNFIYVFVDAIFDTNLDKGADRAIVCFDTNNNKTVLADVDDYCFIVTLDGKRAFVLQGGSVLGVNGGFKKIPSPHGFIGISTVSDENDRYTSVPHPSYEFRIPTELVGRSNIYGFYLALYDAHSNKIYSWPQDVTTEKPFQIASPSKWGELISPDKSLPEFNLPLLTLPLAFLIVAYMRRFRKHAWNPLYLMGLTKK